jgi:hypothetical protein
VFIILKMVVVNGKLFFRILPGHEKLPFNTYFEKQHCSPNIRYSPKNTTPTAR